MTVGFGVVLQQTPLNVIDPPPALVIFPPVRTEFVVIEVIADVVNTGAERLYWILRISPNVPAIYPLSASVKHIEKR